MSMLFNLVFAWKASGTHHKLALDALCHLQHPNAEGWRHLLLKEVDAYLLGAKAPDTKFKDFRNHVLHVGDGFWGGAVATAELWYGRLLDVLRRGDWLNSAYAAGILSHYVSDPFQPYHTGQSEAEEIVHRAAEWSIAQTYEQLRTRLETELGGFPDVRREAGSDWLARLIRAGAIAAHEHYQACIDHYDIARGSRRPAEGMDAEMQARIARQLGLAIVTLARVLDAAFAESGAVPPNVGLSVETLVTALNVPVHWVTRRMADRREQAAVLAMYREYKETGKVLRTLSEDSRAIREAYAAEVLRIPLAELDAQPAGPVGGAFVEEPRPQRVTKPKRKPQPPAGDGEIGEIDASADSRRSDETGGAKPAGQPGFGARFYLRPMDPVVQAPSIGPKTAERLQSIGVKTVADLLRASPEKTAPRLQTRDVTPDRFRAWQAQAQLMCDVPGLRGHDAQMIVAAGVLTRKALAETEPQDLHLMADDYARSAEGQRELRQTAPPDLSEVAQWIASAKSAAGGVAA